MDIASQIVSGVLEGYNGTIFAYGQTSSVSYDLANVVSCCTGVTGCVAYSQGKTHTLTGTAADPGLTPRAIHNLFQLLDNSGLEFMVRVSYIEIYNEEVNDLLRPDNTNLRVFEDAAMGAYVKDLTEVAVCTVEDAMKLLARGNEFRHVSATAMNAKSSRSHTLFRMAVESRGTVKRERSQSVTIEEVPETEEGDAIDNDGLRESKREPTMTPQTSSAGPKGLGCVALSLQSTRMTWGVFWGSIIIRKRVGCPIVPPELGGPRRQ
jgi:hypothetical protein